MKKFSRYLFFLCAATIFILFILDNIYTTVYHTGTPRNKISYLMSLKNDTIDYVFIGSSRVDNNIDAEVVESVTGKTAINLGIQGAEIDEYFIILKLLKERNIKTSFVLIQIDYVFNYDGEYEILKSSLMPYINNKMISGYLKETEEEFILLKYVPFYRYLVYDYKLGFREMFNTLIDNKPNIDFKNGYFPKYGTVNSKLSASLPNHIQAENKHIIQINEFAKENNFRIIYFIAPLCSETKNLNYVEKLQIKLPGLLDFSRVIKQNNSFLDCIHLNDKGAKEFSKIVGKELNSKIEN